MLNATSIKVPKKYEGMIEEIYHDSDGYWAHSAKGFEFEDMGCHTAHEYTQKDLLDMIRTLKPCECSECKEVEVEPVEVAEPTKLNMYVVQVNLITNEKLFGSDWESEHYDLWADDYKVMVAATNIQDALKIAKERAVKRGDKWRSISHDEEYEPRHYYCHELRNDEYTNKLEMLYGRRNKKRVVKTK